MSNIEVPDEVDFLSFFSCEAKRDKYDELTLSYEYTDKENNRLEFSFNEGTQTICTTLHNGDRTLEKSFFEGLSKIAFIDKEGNKTLIAECRNENYFLELSLSIDPLIISWKGTSNIS